MDPYLKPMSDQAQSLFSSEGRLLPERRIRCRSALDAVYFLHSKEVAHLDLKADHFMFDKLKGKNGVG